MKVVPQSRRFAQVACALCTVACLGVVHAQSEPAASSAQGGMVWGSAYDSSDYSLLPYTRRGYLGINLGKPDFGNLPCTPGFACEDPDVGGSVYTGGMFNDWLGLELGYLHMGRAERAGGRTEAQGINVSVVARVPMQQFSLFAKGGTTYGRTKVSADPLALAATGNDSGWGASYGAGVGLDLTPQATLVLEWARHDFHFVGVDKQDLELTSLGLKYRF